MSAFDPFEPATYKQMLRWARSCAYGLGRDPCDGEDALHDVLEQVSGGDSRPLNRGEISLKACVRNRILTGRSQDLSHAEAERKATLEGRGPGTIATSTFVKLVEMDPGREEREMLTLRDVVAPALRDLEAAFPDQARAFRARLRQQLLDCGHEELAAFQRWYGIDLGPLTGTNEVAARFGLPEGTVASHANRGQRHLVETIRSGLERERRSLRARP